jgi:hypothetical protein
VSTAGGLSTCGGLSGHRRTARGGPRRPERGSAEPRIARFPAPGRECAQNKNILILETAGFDLPLLCGKFKGLEAFEWQMKKYT